MNHLFEAHLAALQAAAEARVPELPNSEYENLVQDCIAAVVPDDFVEDDRHVQALAQGLKRLLAQLVLDTLEQYSEELADGGVLDYLKGREELANRAHADDPTSENLAEVESLGRLLREVGA